MSRVIKLAAAQLGAIHLDTPRSDVLARMLALLQSAARQSCTLVLFPETAFTTFFPRHLIKSQADLDTYFEHNDELLTSPTTAPVFDEAKNLGIDISIGFAERTSDGTGYNTSVYYSAERGAIIAKYRKVHLPGTVEPFANPKAVNQLEKRYFSPGNLGFKAFRAPGLVKSAATKANSRHSSKEEPKEQSRGANGEAGQKSSTDGRGDAIFGMLICNDRRWPEAWRCYSLQGAELILCGYNTAGYAPDLWGSDASLTPQEAETEALFHHRLVMQSNSYMNACFSVCAAKAGLEDGKFDLIGGSCIISPEGHVLAEAKTKEDELVVAEVDLAKCRQGKEKTFDFARHRRTEMYGLIASQTGVVEPELL